MTLARDATTAENTTPLTDADSNTTWMELKTNKLEWFLPPVKNVKSTVVRIIIHLEIKAKT